MDSDVIVTGALSGRGETSNLVQFSAGFYQITLDAPATEEYTCSIIISPDSDEVNVLGVSTTATYDVEVGKFPRFPSMQLPAVSCPWTHGKSDSTLGLGELHQHNLGNNKHWE